MMIVGLLLLLTFRSLNYGKMQHRRRSYAKSAIDRHLASQYTRSILMRSKQSDCGFCRHSGTSNTATYSTTMIPCGDRNRRDLAACTLFPFYDCVSTPDKVATFMGHSKDVRPFDCNGWVLAQQQARESRCSRLNSRRLTISRFAEADMLANVDYDIKLNPCRDHGDSRSSATSARGISVHAGTLRGAGQTSA